MNELGHTFMHELGHNFDLDHYGYTDLPEASSEYQSIMSYYYNIHPDRWPSSWDGFPNYGSNPGPDGVSGTVDDWND